MRHSMLHCAAVALVVMMWASGTGADAGVNWETKLDRATMAARETNQPMLIEFWATWCEGCKRMDQEVYSSERIMTGMRKVRPVKIDVDREPGVARRYGIAGTPTLLVTDSFGRELFRYDGALPLERMLQLLDAIPGDVTPINRLSAVLSARKDDFEALSGMGRELRAAGFYRTSSDYYQRALRTRQGRRPGAARAALLIGLERNALALRLFADAVRLCEGALREVRGGPEEPGVRLDLGRSLLGAEKPDEASRVLRSIVAEHPNSPAAVEAERLLADRGAVRQ